ncbi:MAG TPA: O-antigen ligase family protein [Ramlibacter sp.]|uniref:O-antigen ligase family protein n=1 Tax=Ramlibacter sp. TaxID=1917967 RepID=UPI002ED535C5
MPRWAERLAPFATLLACAAPLFVVTLNGWSSGVLFVASLLAILLLARGRLPPTPWRPGERHWLAACVLALLLPVLSVAAAASLRGDAYAAQFDAPARMLLGIPLLLLIARRRVDAATHLAWILPLSLLITLAWHVVGGQPARWQPARMTTSFADPLVFGYLALAFSMMCLMSLAPEDWRRGPDAGVFLRVIGVLLGIYLSVRSGSRSGWAAVPIVLAVWLHLVWGRRHWSASIAGWVLAVLAAVLAYLAVPTVHQRLGLGLHELLGYSWHGVAPDTSVGMRITFLRIAADLVAQHPWAGIGDIHRAAAGFTGAFGYASPEASAMAFRSAFHNQIVTNAVRSGIGGLLATTALLLVPLAACSRRLLAQGYRRNAAMGFAFFLTILVSSLSTEVVDLKYLASFYAAMAAVLCGAALAESHREDTPLSAS